jgi:hypothetical protein
LGVDAWWWVDVVDVVGHISTGSFSSTLSTSSHLVCTTSNSNSQMRWASSLIFLLFMMRCFSSLHTQLHKRLVITALSHLLSNFFGETQVSSSGRILATIVPSAVGAKTLSAMRTLEHQEE